MPRHPAAAVLDLDTCGRVGSQVGPVGGIGDVKFGDAEGAEVKLREGGVVDEVEESGGDNEHKEEDEDEDAEGTAAYAAEVATLPFGLEGGGQHELSRRRWWRFGVGVPVTGGFL